MTTGIMFFLVYFIAFSLSWKASARDARTAEMILREEIAREEARLFFQNGLL